MDRSIGYVQSVWPDLAKFWHFVKMQKVFCNCLRVYLALDKICNDFANFFLLLAKFHFCKWPKIEQILAFWSHCEQAKKFYNVGPSVNETCVMYEAVEKIGMTQTMWYKIYIGGSETVLRLGPITVLCYLNSWIIVGLLRLSKNRQVLRGTATQRRSNTEPRASSTMLPPPGTKSCKNNLFCCGWWCHCQLGIAQLWLMNWWSGATICTIVNLIFMRLGHVVFAL